MDDFGREIALPSVEPEEPKSDPARFRQRVEPSDLLIPLPPVDWVVDGLVARDSVTLVSGTASSFKSWLVAHLAVAVSTGQAFLGHWTTARRGVALIDYEGPERLGRERLCRLASGYVGLLGVHYYPRPGIALNDAEFPDAVRHACADLADRGVPPGLVVVDTLRASVPSEDENDSRIRRHIDALRDIEPTIRPAFVLVHHAGKAEGSNVHQSVRGSSAIVDAVDCVLTLRRELGTSHVTVNHTKARETAELPPFDVAFNFASNPVTVQVVANGSNPGVAALDALIINAIRQTPGITGAKIVMAIHRKKQAVQQRLNHLVAIGVVLHPNKRGGYYLPTTAIGGP